MRRILECITCGTKGYLLLWLDVAIEEVSEELRDVQLVGRCPHCGKQARLSVRDIVKRTQEELDATGD